MMMIRINLLPVRQVKKRELGRQVLVLFGVVLGLAGTVNYLWYDGRESERVRRQTQVSETQRRIAELEKVIGEVNNINKRHREVEDKLKVLTDLRKGRAGPVRMLDALATATPKKVWLKDFTEQANAVVIRGVALSLDDVSEFMRSLSNIVWTPKGLGRMVERKRDSKVTRVELLAGEGVIDEFTGSEIGQFFSGIELKQTSTSGLTGPTSSKRVFFEIQLSANYTI